LINWHKLSIDWGQGDTRDCCWRLVHASGTYRTLACQWPWLLYWAAVFQNR